MGEDGSVKDMKKSDAACRAVQGKAARWWAVALGCGHRVRLQRLSLTPRSAAICLFTLEIKIGARSPTPSS